MRKLMPSLYGAAISILLTAQAMAAGTLFQVVSPSGTVTISDSDYRAIGESEISTKVLTLGDGKRRVSGVLGRDLLAYVNAKGSTVTIEALDGYIMEVPVADLLKYDVILANRIDGAALSVRDKGPVWLIYPVSDHRELDDTIYESRSVWQIKRVMVD
mgnify:FL=1|jgi:hypothetical protein